MLLLSACSSDGDEAILEPPQQERDITPLEQVQIDFINNMVDIMERNSINRNTIDWPSFRTRVLNVAKGKQTREQLDPAISTALGLLKDNHSFVRKPNGTAVVGTSNLDCSIQPDPVKTLENIGYVRVTGFLGNEVEAQLFAEEIQQNIQSQDSEDLIGWVVDLRNNRGGNMWPMLAGIGPILGEGIAGYFVDPEDEQLEWGYFEGASKLSGETITSIATPYELLEPDPKVAVLTNRGAGSSGEAIIVAFRARANTRSFGESSCGVSTSNQGFDLGDDYTLLLTTAAFADRAETLYGGRIAPDEAIADSEVLWARVEEWLGE